MSASGFSWLTASTRARTPDPLDDDIGHRAEVRRQVDGHRRPCVRRFRPGSRSVDRVAGGASGGITADGGSSGVSPSWWTRGDRGRQRLAERQVLSAGAARLELVEQLQDARAPLGRVVELDVQVGDALDAQGLAQLVPHERHRPAERGDRRGRSLGWPMTLTHTLRVAQVGRRLHLRDRGEPDRADPPPHE